MLPFNSWKRGSHFTPTVHHASLSLSVSVRTVFATQRSVKQNRCTQDEEDNTIYQTMKANGRAPLRTAEECEFELFK